MRVRRPAAVPAQQRMYSAANRITPEQMEAIAGFLYTELLAAGYTQVCEFHYLHHGPHGQPFADRATMCHALAAAAAGSGIGLTVLPTLYMHQGFGQPGLSDMQRRFVSTPASVLALRDAVHEHDGWSLRIAVFAHCEARAVGRERRALDLRRQHAHEIGRAHV